MQKRVYDNDKAGQYEVKQEMQIENTEKYKKVQICRQKSSKAAKQQTRNEDAYASDTLLLYR